MEEPVLHNFVQFLRKAFVSDVPFAAIITFVCSHRAKVFGMVDSILVADLYGFFVRVVA